MPDSAQFSHPGMPQLAAFALGKLAGAERAALQAHLAQCPACRQALASLPKASAEPLTQDGAGAAPNQQSTVGAAGAAGPSLDAGVPADLANHPRYEILQLLGRGGMGAVYKARHKAMERVVALKVINASLLGSSTAVERFHREVKAAAKLHHPNIVTAFDAELAGATHFLVMEFVDGTDLARYEQAKGPLPVPYACHFIRQAALGLQHAHEHGMVHRDIKPSNLMLMAGGVVKVMDFGLARLTQEGASPSGLTGENVVMGTADYIAPEQAQDAHKADIRADIYSLGCTLYHLLAGRPPFGGASVMEKLTGHLLGAVPLAELPAPEGLRAVLAKMLAKEPAQRYQTPLAVAQALAPYIKKASVAKAPPAETAGGRTLPAGAASRPDPARAAQHQPDAPARRPSLARPVGVSIVAALLLIVLGFLLWPKSDPGAVPDSRSAQVTKSTKPATPKNTFTNSLGMQFVEVPKGKFLMGGRGGKELEIPHDFYLGVHEVTQGEWERVMGNNPSYFSRTGGGKDRVKDIADAELKRFPVEQVSWDDAQLFAKKLNQRIKEGGWLYRLPSEAEWEYACRGGPPTEPADSFSDFYFDKPTNLLLPDHANFKHEKSLNRTCQVGSYPANRLGLYDMHGNVSEWCGDEVKGADGASHQAPRGGSWYDASVYCRAVDRRTYPPSFRYDNVGLRLARVPVGTEGE